MKVIMIFSSFVSKIIKKYKLWTFSSLEKYLFNCDMNQSKKEIINVKPTKKKKKISCSQDHCPTDDNEWSI